MLKLQRKEGQWVEVVHKSGDVIRIRVEDVGRKGARYLNLTFDDNEKLFSIVRPELSAARKAEHFRFATPRPAAAESA